MIRSLEKHLLEGGEPQLSERSFGDNCVPDLEFGNEVVDRVPLLRRLEQLDRAVADLAGGGHAADEGLLGSFYFGVSRLTDHHFVEDVPNILDLLRVRFRDDVVVGHNNHADTKRLV